MQGHPHPSREIEPGPQVARYESYTSLSLRSQTRHRVRIRKAHREKKTQAFVFFLFRHFFLSKCSFVLSFSSSSSFFETLKFAGTSQKHTHYSPRILLTQHSQEYLGNNTDQPLGPFQSFFRGFPFLSRSLSLPLVYFLVGFLSFSLSLPSLKSFFLYISFEHFSCFTNPPHSFFFFRGGTGISKQTSRCFRAAW